MRNLSNFKTLTTALLGVLLCASMFSSNISAQCSPVYFQKSFQKVYRQHKLFLEGTADFTGDGKPDAYGYQGQGNNAFQNLAVLPNDGAGGFGDPMIINTTFPIDNTVGTKYSHYYGGVAVGDLNADGKPDFVVRGQTSPASFFSVQNNGGGSFTQLAATIANSNERIYQIADLNNDGRGDLVTITIDNFIEYFTAFNTLYYRLGNADGSFGSAVQLAAENLIAPAVGDFNGDGKVDIAYTYYGPGNNYYLKILTNLGGGIFSGPAATIEDVTLAGSADFNNDGKFDLYGDALFMSTGSGFTRSSFPDSPAPTFPTGNYLYRKNWSYVADYNGDGNKDIIAIAEGKVTTGTIVNKYYVAFLGNGAGGFTRANFGTPYLGIPVNMNADNKDEQVIFVNSTTGSQLSSATNEPIVIVRNGLCSAPTPAGQTKLIDFNGDQISDIARWNSSNGDWSYIANLAEGTINWGLGSFGDIPAPGDFDGDGKTDPTVYRNSTGVWYYKRSSDNAWYVLKFGITGDLPVPGDYDGGGKSDIAVYRPSDGNWYILSAETQQVTIMHFGISEDKPVQQDYDGDGKIDIAVFRPSTAVWYYLKSSDGNFGAIKWGISTDQPVPADYDSDGKADIAIFRSGTWYIFRSFDFNYTIASTLNGTPMAVDSDGDGIIELGVYNPNTAWYASGQPGGSYFWAIFPANGMTQLRIFQQPN
jgi:hypothetical protein